MLDESYLPGSNLSDEENEDNWLRSASKKYNNTTTTSRGRHPYSSEKKIYSTPRNYSHSTLDPHGTGSPSTRPGHQSCSERKLSADIMRYDFFVVIFFCRIMFIMIGIVFSYDHMCYSYLDRKKQSIQKKRFN